MIIEEVIPTTIFHSLIRLVMGLVFLVSDYKLQKN